MLGYQLGSGFIDFAKTDFKCPYCNKQYNDSNDKYLNRCNKNCLGVTRIKCQCGKRFYMTYISTGNAVTFK